MSVEKDILKKTISEDTANAIIEQVAVLKARLEAHYANMLNEALEKLGEQKQQLEEQYRRKVNRIKEQYKAKFEQIVERSEEERERLQREYEAKLLEAQSEVEAAIDSLANKVNTFLHNSRDEIYRVVREEYARTHTDESDIKLRRIKSLLEDIELQDNVERARVIQLERDIQRLKERVESKDEAIRRLKAQLRVYEILESVPDNDRPMYEVLFEAETPEEVEKEYKRVRKLVEARRRTEKMIEPKSADPAKPVKTKAATVNIDERILRMAGIDPEKLNRR